MKFGYRFNNLLEIKSTKLYLRSDLTFLLYDV